MTEREIPQKSTANKAFSSQVKRENLGIEERNINGWSITMANQRQDDTTSEEENDLEILQDEALRLIEANEKWFEEYEKGFRASLRKKANKKRSGRS